MYNKVIAGLLFATLLVLAIALWRMWTLETYTLSTEDIHQLEFDKEPAFERLATALSIPTESHAIEPDSSAFFELHAFIESSYPLVHEELQREIINELTLSYQWRGANPDATPIKLMAHQDVVPAQDSADWTHDPYGGVVDDGYIWGRGALDNKSGVMGILEAIEWLIEQGYQPPQPVYLTFGHDEEIGGYQGAQAVARHFEQEGIRFDYVLDEGGAIITGAMDGVDEPVATVGVSEKGFLSVEITARMPGGHSSLPQRETAIGLLTRALNRLADNPLAVRIDGATSTMLDRVSPVLPQPERFFVANRWLFEPLLRRELAQSPVTEALVRTTKAPTMLYAGVRDNVIPSRATGVVNFRLLPGDTQQDVLDHVKRVIDDDRFTYTTLQPSMEASPISRVDGSAFQVIEQTIHEVTVDDDLIVSPYLVPGATDSRHFTHIADDVYRFAAFSLGAGDEGRIHGIDERISKDDYARMIRFYVQLLRNGNGGY